MDRFFWYLTAVLFACVALFGSNINHTFWLDECISIWVASGSIEDVFNRALQYLPYSPLYYGILGLWVRCFGISLLHVLSFITVFLAIGLFTFFVYTRKGKKVMFVAVLLFLTNLEFLHHISWITPHGFAIVSFCAFLVVFQRGVEIGHPLFLMLSVLAGGATLYFQPMYLAGLFISSICLTFIGACTHSEGKLVRAAIIFVLTCLIASPCLVLFGDYLSIRAGDLMFSSYSKGFVVPYSIARLSFLLVPLGCCLVYDCIAGRAPKAVGYESLLFFAAGLTGPLILLSAALAGFTRVKIHYVYWCWPLVTYGMAIYIVQWLGDRQGLRDRCFVVYALVALILIQYEIPLRLEPAWNVPRDLLIEMGPPEEDDIILLHTGLSGAQSLESDNGFMTAPLFVYPVAGRAKPVAPFHAGTHQRAAFIEKFREPLRAGKTVFFVSIFDDSRVVQAMVTYVKHTVPKAGGVFRDARWRSGFLALRIDADADKGNM